MTSPAPSTRPCPLPRPGITITHPVRLAVAVAAPWLVVGALVWLARGVW